MPEAPVDKDGDLPPGEDDVGSDESFAQTEAQVLSEAQTSSVKLAAQPDLR